VVSARALTSPGCIPRSNLEEQLQQKEQQVQQLRLLSQTRQRSDDGEVVIKAHMPLGQVQYKQQQYEQEAPR
jgi:hypothetical protein